MHRIMAKKEGGPETEITSFKLLVNAEKFFDDIQVSNPGLIYRLVPDKNGDEPTLQQKQSMGEKRLNVLDLQYKNIVCLIDSICNVISDTNPELKKELNHFKSIFCEVNLKIIGDEIQKEEKNTSILFTDKN